MNIEDLKYRKAKLEDLAFIISLLIDDELGKQRENITSDARSSYERAFEEISDDKNQYLMVVEYNSKIIATCHLTLIPSLTFKASKRMQIEAVRVSSNFRGKKIGEYMIQKAIEYGQSKDAIIIQLTSNKSRKEAINFYRKLGFKDSHEGMKLYLENT